MELGHWSRRLCAGQISDFPIGHSLSTINVRFGMGTRAANTFQFPARTWPGQGSPDRRSARKFLRDDGGWRTDGERDGFSGHTRRSADGNSGQARLTVGADGNIKASKPKASGSPGSS